jgi:hypothetical protein
LKFTSVLASVRYLVRNSCVSMLTFGRRKLRAEGAGTWECIRVTLLNTILHP